MKRSLIAVALASAFAFVAAGPASASCKKISCVNGKISTLTSKDNTLRSEVSTLTSEDNTLTSEVNTLTSEVNTLTPEVSNDHTVVGDFTSCFEELPITQYGDPAGTFGYEFSNDGATNFYTTALDATASGDAIGAWFLVDACNSQTTASTAHVAGRAPLAPHINWGLPLGK